MSHIVLAPCHSQSGGQRQPIIGTRLIESTIRLKDGETNFLAGLIRTDESNGEVGIPGLSDIPILGRLFGKTTTDVKRTDLMLTLTPHIIRTPDVTGADLLPIWVGTESNITFRGGSPRVESEAEGPFEPSEEGKQLLEEKIRQQMEQLPPGLRQEDAPAAPLAPASGPSDPFNRKPEPTQEENLETAFQELEDKIRFEELKEKIRVLLEQRKDTAVFGQPILAKDSNQKGFPGSSASAALTWEQ